MTSKQITIKDLARELNIHHSTVSRALRNDPRVNQKTKDRILALAREWEYHPNSVALNLRDRRSKTIGLLVPSIHNHFFSHIISSITNLAYECGYNVMICQSNESQAQESFAVKSFIQNRVAGVIASISLSTTDASAFELLKKQHIPLVFFDRIPEAIEAVRVMVDNYQSSYHAVSRMIDQGYQRIAHVTGGLHINVFRDRYQGYADALKDNGIQLNEQYIFQGDFTKESGTAAAEHLLSLKEAPDLIFAVAFEPAVGVLAQAQKLNLRIPDDLGLICMGEDPLSTVLCPSLTTIEQPRTKLAERAFKLLCGLIDGSIQSPVTEKYEAALHLRASTERTVENGEK